MEDNEKLITFKHSKLKKYFGFFSAILSINKTWFFCSLIATLFLFFLFSFAYIYGTNTYNSIKWSPMPKIITSKNYNLIEEFYQSNFLLLTLFFAFCYIAIFALIFIFAYVLFFVQLKNKRFRFAFYSSLSRKEVFFLLLATLFFYVLINLLLSLLIILAFNLPFYQSKSIAIWEVFNIYLNVFLVVFVLILCGYLLWNKPNTLFVALTSIIFFLFTIFVTISRSDLFIIYVKDLFIAQYGKKNLALFWSTMIPVNGLTAIKYIPFVGPSMTSVYFATVSQYLNLIYFLIISGLALFAIYFLNKKVSL